MSFFSFVGEKLSLLINKNDILDEARITEDEFRKFCLPTYKTASESFGKDEPKHVTVKKWFNLFKSEGLNTGSAGFYESMHNRLLQVLELHQGLMNLAEDKFTDKSVLGGLTLDKTNIIKIFALNRSITRYSLKLLNYIHVCEYSAAINNPKYIEENLTVKERENIEKYVVEYYSILSMLTKNKIETSISKIDNAAKVVSGQNDDILISTLGIDKIDPLNISGKMGFNGSPVLWFKEISAVNTAKRYKEKEELKSILELRLINLQRAKEKNPDSSLDDQILITASRIERLNREINDIEESIK